MSSDEQQDGTGTASSSSSAARQQEQVKVSDEFVALNAPVVFRCRPNGGAQIEFSQLVEWFTSDGLQIGAGETSKGNKFTAFKSGELHLANVEMADLQRTYGCRLRNSISGQVSSSSGLAQLVLTDAANEERRATSGASSLPQVLHTTSQLVADDLISGQQPLPGAGASLGDRWSTASTNSHFHLDQQQQQQQQQQITPESVADWRLLLPCAVRSQNNRHRLRWFYQAPGRSGEAATPIEQWAASRGTPLMHLNQLVNAAELSNTTSSGTNNGSGGGKRPRPLRSRILLGSSFLAIEWPSRAHSGRYIGQLISQSPTTADSQQQQQQQQDDVAAMEFSSSVAATVCDINVIIRQPLKLRLSANLDSSSSEQAALFEAYTSAGEAAQTDTDSSVLNRAFNWWFGSVTNNAANKEYSQRVSRQAARTFLAPLLRQSNPLLDTDQRRVQVRGAGAVLAPPVAQLGQRLQLDCWATGYPVDSVRWFRNGQPINTQSSNDFQVEISQTQVAREDVASADEQLLLSSLLIRQLQAKDHLGLNLFECFGQSSTLGDRARAALAVLVLDRHLVDWARGACPVSVNGTTSPAEFEEASSGVESEPEESGQFGWQSNVSQQDRQPATLLRRHNPWQRALLLETEFAELVCPASLSGNAGRVEWRKWDPNGQEAAQQTANGQQDSSSSGRNSNFNQLFSGDSRFVINGSSLQIRSASKRQDEALYVCRALDEPLTSQQQQQQQQKVFEANSNGLGGSASSQRVHQSSLASSALSCSAQLAQTLFQTSSSDSTLQLSHMSSISIRIVAKPKIDPFEFSRNLEEGMRAVLVCTVVSGQSPVDISWFKDGELFVADEGHSAVSLDQANSFSSTLTFHRIRPDHSGLYTCVAANAFAATQHSSRLVVNVAPYFIDPPSNTRAVVGSNVLVNCRAAGQPSPQIRWRKLVPIGSNTSASKQSPSNANSVKLVDAYNEPSLSSDASVQMAPLSQQVANKFEFRVITSNSHIQILENGSMIIKEVELSDSSRYVCQAFNGINPSLSEVIDLQVLSPAQFEVNYETIGVKRDSMIKFNCAPRGDQPMQIEWRKESNYLVAGNNSESQRQQAKYSEIAHLVMLNNSSSGEQQVAATQQRHNILLLQQTAPDQSSIQWATSSNWAIRSSELFINFADRADTGSFTCIARNPYGKDQLTYRLIVQEVPDVPLNVQIQNVLANSLRLSWTAPFDGNLPISHYAVEYRKLTHQQSSSQSSSSSSSSSSLNEWTRLVVNANKLATSPSSPNAIAATTGDIQVDTQQVNSGASPIASSAVTVNKQQTQPTTATSGLVYSLTLRQLNAKSAYHLRVAAVNAAGQGAFSTHLSVTTSEEPPNARASDLRTQPISSSSLKVLWRGPAVSDEQAPVKGYYVSHRKLIAPQQGGSSSVATAKEVQETQNGVASSGQLLWLGTATVSASNSSYGGEESSISLAAAAAQARQQLLPVSANYEHLLIGLEKSTRYEVRVQPYNSMGVGPPSETFGQTLKFDRPGQPSLRLVAARRQSLELQWSLGSDDQPLMGFSLFYKCEYDDWQEIQLAPIYRYVVENLRCGNKYQIYLSAFNAVGRSDPSDVLSVRTEGTAPIAPDKSRFFKANISEMILDMSGWQSGGCPISSFMIQFKRLHESNWFVLSEGSTPFTSTDRITIPDLSPATWYKLLVTALNEAGSTNAEYVVSTLSVTGEPIMPSFPLSTEQLNGESSRSNSLWNNLSQLLLIGGNQVGSTSGNNTQHSLLLPLSALLLLTVLALSGYLYRGRNDRSTNGHLKGNSGLTATRSPSSSDASGSATHEMAAANAKRHYLTGSGGGGGNLSGNVDCYAALGAPNLCDSMLASTNSSDEKQLIQSSGHQHQLHQFVNSSLLPLDATARNSNNNSVLDTLVGSAGLHSFMGCRAAAAAAAGANGGRQQHGMKLLSSGNLFQQQSTPVASNCTSASISTHSTGCLDGAGSSSSGASVVGAGFSSNASARATKLQLVDQSSSLIEDTLEEARAAQDVYLYNHCSQQSPERALHGIELNLEQQQQQHHVDVLSQPPGELLDNQQSLFQNAEIGARTTALYGHRALSSSFASAAELAQRQQQHFYYQQPPTSTQQQQQQQQQIHLDEPVYQRLDRYQLTYGLPCGKQQQFAASQAAKSQTLRFATHHHNNNNNNQQQQQLSIADDSLLLKSMTVQRNQQQPTNYLEGLYSPQAAPNGFHDQSSSFESAAQQQQLQMSNHSELMDQHIICQQQQQQ